MVYEFHYRHDLDEEPLDGTYPENVEPDTMVFVGAHLTNSPDKIFGPIPARLVDWSRVRCWREARAETSYS